MEEEVNVEELVALRVDALAGKETGA